MDKVVHFEIPVDNVKRATDFYKKTFGWNIVGVPDMEYNMVYTTEVDKKYMVKEKGVINGGMMKRNTIVKSPVININVENIDKSLKNVEKNGGKVVMKKIKVGDFGLSAYIKDTEGNVMGVWQSVKKM